MTLVKSVISMIPTSVFIPTSPNLKEKSVHLLEATMNTPCEKDLKCKNPLNISKNCFLFTGLRFAELFQNLMPHIKIMKFCQNHRCLLHTTVITL
jgi:hypothetical protein